jgi:hypothetical protein
MSRSSTRGEGGFLGRKYPEGLNPQHFSAGSPRLLDACVNGVRNVLDEFQNPR